MQGYERKRAYEGAYGKAVGIETPYKSNEKADRKGIKFNVIQIDFSQRTISLHRAFCKARSTLRFCPQTGNPPAAAG